MCGIVAYYGGAGNNLTRVLTGMSAIIYRAPDSTGVGIWGDDTAPIRTRKAVGDVSQLIDTLHQRPIYPSPATHLTALFNPDKTPDAGAHNQRQLLRFEGLSCEVLEEIHAERLTYPGFDELVALKDPQPRRLTPGWPGRPSPNPTFLIRSRKDLLRLIRHLISEYDLSPLVIQTIIRKALLATIERKKTQASLPVKTVDILHAFDDLFEKSLIGRRISKPRRLNYGHLTKSPYAQRYLWRALIESPIQIPSDYDRDGVRCVFRLLDAALLSRLSRNPQILEALEEINAMQWPVSQRPTAVDWRSLYSAEKGVNIYGWAAAAAITYLQREEFLPAVVNQLTEQKLMVAEAIVPGQTDPMLLRYLSLPILSHGRWAVQSAVTVKNAHPFVDRYRQRALVVNGQFDAQVEERLQHYLRKVAKHSFRSENSAEYLVLLWEHYFDLLADEQRRAEAIHTEVKSRLEKYGIGSQTIDYGVFNQVQGKSPSELDQIAFLKSAKQIIADGGQVAVAAMSLHSPRRLYVASHNRPVFIVHRLENDDFMVVSDINAAMGLFPQALIHSKLLELETLRRQHGTALARLQAEGAGPEAVESVKKTLAKKQKTVLQSFEVAVYPLDGEEVFACIESDLETDALYRQVTITTFQGQPLPDIEPFRTTLNPTQVRKDFGQSFHQTHLAEVPEKLTEIMRSYLADDAEWPNFKIRKRALRRRFGRRYQGLRRIVLVGAGSSYHMGKIARNFMQSVLPNTDLMVLSPGDISARPMLINPSKDLCLLLSWSSTTAEMVQVAKHLMATDTIMVAITEKIFADMALVAQKSGGVVPILSGEEVTVSGIKSTLCMLFVLNLFGAWLCGAKGDIARACEQVQHLKNLPEQIANLMQDQGLQERSRELAQRYVNRRGVLVIDAQNYSGVGGEIALKLEQNSWSTIGKTYDYQEVPDGLQAADMERILVILNATCRRRLPEALQVAEQLKQKGIDFVAVTIADQRESTRETFSAGRVVRLPDLYEPLQSFVDLTFYYQFAFDFSLAYGRAIGEPPRNLAKSMTISRSEGPQSLSAAAHLRALKENNLAFPPLTALETNLETPSVWESQMRHPTARKYFEEMRCWAAALCKDALEPSHFDFNASTTSRLREALFEDVSYAEEIVCVPLDRHAEGVAHFIADQWGWLLGYPVHIKSPWEAASNFPAGALLLALASGSQTTTTLYDMLAGCDGPMAFVGPRQTFHNSFLAQRTDDTFFVHPPESGVGGDSLYMGINALMCRLWETFEPEKAAWVKTHLQLVAHTLMGMLNQASLLHSIQRAMDANHRYDTAFFISSPAGHGPSWVAYFDGISRFFMEAHYYGASVHGPLVTVDPRVARKFVKLETRKEMMAQYGERQVALWEGQFLQRQDVDQFIAKPRLQDHHNWHSPFFAEADWYLPVLHPTYRTDEDNLIIIDATSERFLPQAMDELATFGCRHPRMIVITQEPFLTAIGQMVGGKFPIADMVVIPGVKGHEAQIPLSAFHLSLAMNLVAMAMAATSTKRSPRAASMP